MIRLVEVAGSLRSDLIVSSGYQWHSRHQHPCNRYGDKFSQLQRRGWQAADDPVRYTFGPFEVTEWITRGRMV